MRASDPSGEQVWMFIHPSRSLTYASRVPSGEKRGCSTASGVARVAAAPSASTPATAVVGPSGQRQTTMRESSHGMAGKSHSCQVRSAPSGDQHGSKAKSEREQITGVAGPVTAATATAQVSCVSAT
ncbi:MAG: hypothetical protein M5U31_08575 [Acidimicrobiia bacterium]|nr:hypothetical protein [Acidimicrobiia bacterium]